MSLMNKNILIVEDDEAINEVLTMMLTREGYGVFSAEDTNTAMNFLKQEQIDLILLDWMLPNVNRSVSGIEFAIQLRHTDTWQHLPIIMLTAKAEEEDKLAGFNIGVDDYITKPFSMNEVLARVKSVLRRSKQVVETIPDSTSKVAAKPANNIIALNGIHLDFERHLVHTDAKEEIHLGPKEFKLLSYLMQNPGRVFSRDNLLDNVWGENIYIEERTVDVHIGRLRKALESHDLAHLIRTVRGSGYSFRDA